MKLITPSSTATTMTATSMATRKLLIKKGSVCPIPPAVVINPVTAPRSHGDPRPVSEPSSESPSEKAIEIPAPIEAASPTRNASQLLCEAKAAANSGASVETDPSILRAPAAPLVAKTTSGAIRLRLPWRSVSSVFLPVRPLSVCAFSLRPQVYSAILALIRLSFGLLRARRTGLPPVPSLPPVSWRLSRPAAGPATPVSVAGIPSRFPAGSEEYDRRNAAGTSQTTGRGASLLPRASLRTFAPLRDTLPAAHPQTPRKSVHLLLPRRLRSPESLFPSNP